MHADYANAHGGSGGELMRHYVVDPAHNQPIPHGQFLARIVRPILAAAKRTAADQARHGHPVDLSRWVQPFMEQVLPEIERLTLNGLRGKAREIYRQIQAAPQSKSLAVYGSRFPTRRKSLFTFSFDLLLPQVLESVRRAAFNLAQSTLATASTDANKAIQAAREQLRQGLTHGETMAELGRRFFQIFQDPYKASRIAQSESSRAHHQGQLEAAKESSVVTGTRWLASSDCCDRCAALAGKEVPLGTPFFIDPKGGPYSVVMHPPLHPNCVLGETPILAPGAVGGVSAKYSGPILRIVLVSGDSFSVTPNHMLLTGKGFAFASSLVEGDEVISCPNADRLLGDVPDNQRKPTRIDEMVSSLAKKVGMMSDRVPISAEYLHGDAAFCDGEIDVVHADGLLMDGANADSLRDGRGEGQFARGAIDRRFRCSTFFPRISPLEFLFEGVLAATSGFIGTGRDCFAFLDAQRRISLGQNLLHRFGYAFDAASRIDQTTSDSRSRASEGLSKTEDGFASFVSSDKSGKINLADRGGPCADLSPSRYKCLTDAVDAAPKMLGDFRNRHSGLVSSNRIRQIEVVFVHNTPVYDVETNLSMYILPGGVVSSNCMCSAYSLVNPIAVDSGTLTRLRSMAFASPTSLAIR